MLKQLQVAVSLKALVASAAPRAELIGFDEPTQAKRTIGDGGLVVGEIGEPGDPEIDLSPPAYNYSHPFGIQIGVRRDVPSPHVPAALSDILAAIGVKVRADRYLGGLCTWLEARAPTFEDTEQDGAVFAWAELELVADYSTSDPLA